MSDRQNESSEESDEEYVPPVKRSKSEDSGPSNQELESAREDLKYDLVDKSKLDLLWQEFKQDTATKANEIEIDLGNTETKDKVPSSLSEAEVDSEHKKGIGISIISPSPQLEEGPIAKDSKVARSAPGKSRLNQLLTARTMKKRQKPENILNSSKRDWECLKLREDLSDELIHHNKDGFIQRQDFLKRCEEREHDDLLEARKRKK